MIENISGWAADAPLLILTHDRANARQLVTWLLESATEASHEPVVSPVIVTDDVLAWIDALPAARFEALSKSYRAGGACVVDLGSSSSVSLESRSEALGELLSGTVHPLIVVLSPNDPLLDLCLSHISAVFAFPDSLHGLIAHSSLESAEVRDRSQRWRIALLSLSGLIRSLDASPFGSQLLELVWDWDEVTHRVLRYGFAASLTLPLKASSGVRVVN